MAAAIPPWAQSLAPVFKVSLVISPTRYLVGKHRAAYKPAAPEPTTITSNWVVKLFVFR